MASIMNNNMAGYTLEQLKAMGAKKQGFTLAELKTKETPIKKSNLADNIWAGIGGFATGAGKGALSTIQGLSTLGQKALGGIYNPVMPEKPIVKLPEQLTTPEGTAQKIGFGAEQIGEFFIPASELSKATKAIEGSIDVLKIGNAAKSALKLATKSAIEGVGMGTVSTAQIGNIAEGIKSGGIGGLIMGGLGIVGKAISKIVGKIPETAWSNILKRIPTAIEKNPQLEKQIAKEGISGISRSTLSRQMGGKIQEIELSISDLLKGREGQISTKAVTTRLNELKQTYTNIPGEESSIKVIDNVSQGLLAKGENIGIQEANQLKRDIYGLIQKSYGKGLLEIPAKTEAQKMIARGLKEEIEKVIPEVKDLNAKQAIYLQTKKAIDKTIARQTGKGIAGTGIGLYDILTGGVGTLAGTAAGMPIAGLGLVAVKKGIESPAFLSTVSAGTQKMINYFEILSPTQRLLFYSALRGIIGESTQ